MSNDKKNRMAMLDSLSGSPAPLATSSFSRPVRAARDAVDYHRVWELDPDQIEDQRVRDRLNLDDVDDLRESIETTGQTVPILVRRHPADENRYLLVYGRRRLEAIRSSKDVNKVKALIANLDDTSAVEAQVSENAARRDLSYIEKALFAHELSNSGYGSQVRVAEVLGVTKSWMSMALSIVETVTPEVIQAIGPTPGIGRPRWEAFSKAMAQTNINRQKMVELADHKRKVLVEYQSHETGSANDFSVAVLETMERVVRQKLNEKTVPAAKDSFRHLSINGTNTASVKRSGKKVRLEIEPGEFANWVEQEAQSLVEQMHIHWLENKKK